MRLTPFAVLSVVALSVGGFASAQTPYRQPDGSAAYGVPAGIEVTTQTDLAANQTAFAIVRTAGGQKTRAGVCVLGVKTLAGMPNQDTWKSMVLAHRMDTDAKAKASVKAPAAYVRLGGYRDLALGDVGDGFAFWYQQSAAAGESTEVSLVALIRPQSLLTGSCSSSRGFSFTPVEIERILQLTASARRP